MSALRIVFAATVAAALAAAPGAAAAQGPVVPTASGPVRGLDTGAMQEFLGIPYAAPPVGKLRWRPPQPAASWTGVRDATQFGPHCPQLATPYGTPSSSEDCLYLNVFTPEKTNNGVPHLRPVMVWIHGGALVVGESDDYDPSMLVARGVIVVTLNYRLGELGFLAHPALAGPDGSSGDYGLMDQQAALRWVQANIRGFGGDPSNVTMFGESAGGLSVHSQLASPLAAGLFQKAIVESGAYSLTQPSLTAAEAAGQSWADDVGCPDQSAACLRSLSVQQILAGPTPASIVPNVDGAVLTQSIGTAFATGAFNRVPVIEGSNHDEWRLFVAQAETLTHTPVTAATYVPAIAASLGVPLPTAAFFASLYPAAAYPSASEALGALGTDLVFACNTRRAAGALSQYVPTYQYEFADENAPMAFFPPVSFPTGAYHASEIQYLFNEPTTPLLSSDQQLLSAAMVRYWTQFATDGNPNSAATPAWPLYDTTTQQFQSLVPPAPATATGFATEHNCILWGG
jgi:para-nitrobenzyl esterase